MVKRIRSIGMTPRNSPPVQMGRLGLLLFPLIAAGGCAVTPPVQEMSDARQAISAAREAQADRFAPATLLRAEQSLEEAARGMEQQHYLDAREAARQARQEAIRARDEALGSADKTR